MFTFDHIDKIHDQLGKSDTLLAYAKALGEIGVLYYDTYVSDGHSEYFGSDGHSVASPVYHETFVVADTSDKRKFNTCMKLVEQGKLNYYDMSKALAECGIEKWTMDTTNLTFTYLDKSGKKLLVENLS